MEKYLPDIDYDKLKKVLSIKERYNNNELSLEEARKLLFDSVHSLKPYEIALAEQKLKEFDEDECKKEDIQKMLELFDGIIDLSKENISTEHPISKYYQENEKLKEILLSIEDLVQYPVIKNQWYEIYDSLKLWWIHLSRKQNQLYSVLEKKGFDRPTTTMWTLDKYIQDEIRMAREVLETDEEEFINMQAKIVADIRDLISKEENILYSTALKMISDSEFEEMKIGDKEIGYAWIDSIDNVGDDIKVDTADENSSFTKELTALFNKYNIGNDKKLDVAQGKLTLEQINLIYKHMPVDLSYVDENELVCFYTDTAHRVFPRSKNVIGRNVMNCHPRTSAHVVREIIDRFKAGESDNEEFWIDTPKGFIYIYYVAVRDENGKFRGILEMMQDCTHIRELVGNKTLLSGYEK